jgi:hypothetical protein
MGIPALPPKDWSVRMDSHWIDSIRRTGAPTAVLAAAMGLLACTSMGSGTGTLRPDDTQVTFSWTSKDGGNSGTMSATMRSGAAFSGPFLQMTSAVRTDTLQPLWSGWRRGWSDWEFWSPYPETAFSTRYSGKVVANLSGPDAQQLRCRFHLNDPVAGMGGGGQGECQFTGGRTVDAVFERS